MPSELSLKACMGLPRHLEVDWGGAGPYVEKDLSWHQIRWPAQAQVSQVPSMPHTDLHIVSLCVCVWVLYSVSGLQNITVPNESYHGILCFHLILSWLHLTKWLTYQLIGFGITQTYTRTDHGNYILLPQERCLNIYPTIFLYSVKCWG